MTVDVIVVGGGPAGAIASILLARQGARVRLFDRSRFPRHKLCGDTVNPGARALLRRFGLGPAADTGGLPVSGMIVSGRGVVIRAEYPAGIRGVAMTRAVLDARLIGAAQKEGVEIEEGALVSDVVWGGSGDAAVVTGVRVRSRGGPPSVERGRVCIAADGRHSRLAFSLGLSRFAARPRRWAIGAYFTDVEEVTSFGEMHIREGHYVGVAAVPGGLTNVCLVTAERERLRDPEQALRDVLASDILLRERFVRARRAGPVVTLGPLAVESRAAGTNGLLLAGDAAGFIDPMTGDGLRFAFRGAELAARAAARVLSSGDPAAHRQLAAWRREFSRKRTFNRALRALVDVPGAVRVATAGAKVAPAVLRYIVRTAGDVPAA